MLPLFFKEAIDIFTPIELDKVRNFQFGMQALNRIEDKLKCNVAKIDWDNLSVKQTAIIMWAGLVHEDNKLTPDKIMELVDRHSTYNKAAARLMEAVTEAFGVQEEEKNE